MMPGASEGASSKTPRATRVSCDRQTTYCITYTSTLHARNETEAERARGERAVHGVRAWGSVRSVCMFRSLGTRAALECAVKVDWRKRIIVTQIHWPRAQLPSYTRAHPNQTRAEHVIEMAEHTCRTWHVHAVLLPLGLCVILLRARPHRLENDTSRTTNAQ